MKLLCVQEHLVCENYEKRNDTLFDNIFLKEGEAFDKNIEEAEIVFVLSGMMRLSCNNNESVYQEDSIILLPPASNLKINVFNNLHLIVLHVKSSIYLCNVQSLEDLFDKQSIKPSGRSYMPINEMLKSFLTLLSTCLEDGLRCKCFIELKAKELFYYFRAYYKKELLREFFAPLLTKDYDFSVFVMKNHRKVKTVQQFADLYGVSLSCFVKQFKKIFRTSAYQWMTQKKSEAIYNDLIYTDLTLIELADEYDFSSLSQFCDFCRRVFGTSPGKIRSSKNCLNKFTTIPDD